MNSVELAGQLYRDLYELCSDELKALVLKSPNYFTSQMPLDAVRLDNN